MDVLTSKKVTTPTYIHGDVCGLCFDVDYASYVASMAWTMLPLCCSMLALWPELCGSSMVWTMRLPMLAFMIHL
jgi:hypothetical protein